MATMTARIYVPISGLPQPDDLPDVGAMTPPVKEVTTLTSSGSAVSRLPAGDSLVASATRLTSASLTDSHGKKRGSGEQWQEDAWEMYDLVGEMRFLVNVLASQASKARFYVGVLSDDPTEPPVPTTDARLTNALEAIGDGPTGLSQLIKRLYVNLQVPGDGWLVGIPKGMMPEERRKRAALIDADGAPVEAPPMESLADVNLDDLVWRMLSVTEVKFDGDDVVLALGDGKADEVTTTPDEVIMIRVWGSHPRRAWEADSPTRSALPVLRELVGLTMHISAQIDSRLAGAGIIIAPESAARAAKIALGLDPDGPDDPFTDALIKAMMTPISDRANASAYVPLVWTVPDAAAPSFRYLDQGDRVLDVAAKDMREEAIRRYALSADAPPDLLLGLGGMNHWGAWLVQEDVVRAHLEPSLALVADALTTQYLRPVMEEIGTYEEGTIENHVVWYDVEHLIVRVSKRDDAREAYRDGVISAAAYRDAAGFSEDDAPEVADDDPAVTLALEMVAKAPSLAQNPGIPELVAQLREVLEGGPPAPDPNADADAEVVVEEVEGDDPLPEVEDEPPTEVEPVLASRVAVRARRERVGAPS